MYHCNNCMREIDSYDYYSNDGLCDYCYRESKYNDYEESEDND